MNQLKYNKKLWITMLVLALFFLAMMTRHSWLRYDIFQQEGDLAAYDNAIYNSTVGRFMQSTIGASVLNFWPIVAGNQPTSPISENMSILGIHFIPTLFITNALPYFIWPHAKNTLFIQVLGIVVTALILFYLFQFLNIHPYLAFGSCSVFLFHPATIGALSNAFHPVVMALPLIAAMLIFFYKERWIWYYLFFFLTCGIQENVILSVLAMSFLFLYKKKWLHFIFHFALSMAIFLIVTKLLIPHFNPKGVMPYESAYGSPLGSSMNEIIINGLKNPLLAFNTFFTQEKTVWMYYLVLPFLFFSFISPIYLFIAFVGIGPNLVSNNKAMLLMWGQYNALAMPFLAIGAAIGAQKLYTLLRTKNFTYYSHFPFITATIMIITTLGLWNKFGKDVPSIAPQRIFQKDFSQELNTPHVKHFQEILALIEPDKSLSAPDELLNKTHQRKMSYIFPVNFPLTEQIVILKKHPYIPQEKLLSYIETIKNSNFRLTHENDTLLLYKKNL